jgi:hypothetical protein
LVSTVQVIFMPTVRLIRAAIDYIDNNPSLLFMPLVRQRYPLLKRCLIAIGKHLHESYMSRVGIG